MKNKYNILVFLIVVIIASILMSVQVTFASPFGAGKYSALVPYGGQTSLTISTSGNVVIGITPTTTGTLGTASGTVTVVSTDVVGYKLYISSLGASTSMVNGSTTLPASSNTSGAPLVVDTWGYNVDGSTNFVGITTTNALILNASGPYESGNTTTITYGVNIDLAKPAGQYSANVIYTAVPQTN